MGSIVPYFLLCIESSDEDYGVSLNAVLGIRFFRVLRFARIQPSSIIFVVIGMEICIQSLLLVVFLSSGWCSYFEGVGVSGVRMREY